MRYAGAELVRYSLLIGIMVAIVVGVNLIPAIVGEAEEVVNGIPPEPEGALALVVNVLPLVFVAIILLGAVAWIGGMGEVSLGGRVSTWITGRPNSKSLEGEFASRSWDFRDDRKNLDRLLGVQIEPIAGTEEEPLQLRERTLFLSKEFIWYLDGKSPKGIMYKVVGLNQRHKNLNSVFILGRDAHTTIPFLLRLPPNFLRESLEECLRWCIISGKGDILKEV